MKKAERLRIRRDMEMWPSAMVAMLRICQKLLKKNAVVMCTMYAEFDGGGRLSCLTMALLKPRDGWR